VNDREHLQRQMAEIGNRYLQRTTGELVRIREIVARLGDGAVELCEELEHIAHRIHGSGAMFGFDAVSEQARRIEVMATRRSFDADQVQELEEHVSTLEAMVLDAARSRGLEAR
jgi:HPt (histidine-containing phosphotransfer) domain-containing protein